MLGQLEGFVKELTGKIWEDVKDWGFKLENLVHVRERG